MEVGSGAERMEIEQDGDGQLAAEDQAVMPETERERGAKTEEGAVKGDDGRLAMGEMCW